jgi:uncharacterized membrane protein YeaQ/YmgE (transglycosylase-associated protein family)
MSFLILCVVGLIGGALTSVVVGGVGLGILGDVLIGIVGAFLGGWLFSALGIRVPFTGMGGTIFVAFSGAVVSVLALRVICKGKIAEGPVRSSRPAGRAGDSRP